MVFINKYILKENEIGFEIYAQLCFFTILLVTIFIHVDIYVIVFYCLILNILVFNTMRPSFVFQINQILINFSQRDFLV